MASKMYQPAIDPVSVTRIRGWLIALAVRNPQIQVSASAYRIIRGETVLTPAMVSLVILREFRG